MGSAHNKDDTKQYRLARNGDIAARDDMVQQHMGLVAKLATYYAKRNPYVDLDDIFQEGRIGIITALNKFDVDAGYRFSTYAAYWIKHYIQRFIVSTHAVAASSSRYDAESYIHNKLDNEDRKLYELRCIQWLSIHDISDDDGGCISELVAADEPLLEDMVIDREQGRLLVKSLFDSSVTPNQRVMVCMRYGILGYKQYTTGEIAREFGVTRQVVSREIRSVLNTLREVMERDEWG